jgi:hypothetical protein
VAVLTWKAMDATVATARARPRGEEGGWPSRIAPIDSPLSAVARVTHFTNRTVAFLDRRIRGARSSREID